MGKNEWGLTDKQLEVLSLMAEGYSPIGITKILEIKKSTVMTHIYNIYMALGLHDAEDEIHQYTTAALMYLKREGE